MLLAAVGLILLLAAYLMKVLKGPTDQKSIEDVASTLKENLWVVVLTVGWVISLISFLADSFREGPKALKETQLLWEFLGRKGPELCTVLLLSVLADFVVHILDFLRQVQGEIKITKGQIGESQNQLVDYDQKLQGLVRSSEETYNKMDRTLAHLYRALAQLDAERLLHSRLIEIEERESKPSVNQEQLKRVADYVRSVVRVKDEGDTSLFLLRERTSSALLHYLSDNCSFETVVQARIATAFLDSALGSLLGAVPPSTLPYAPSRGVDHKKTRGSSNFIQANYAILSAVVDALYSSSEELYDAISSKRSEPFQLVFFTTLTMPIDRYLNPKEITTAKSFVWQWNSVRHQTRKTMHNLDGGKSQYGHMYRFALLPDKYEFRRCCLYLDENNSPSSEQRQGLWTKNEWEGGIKPLLTAGIRLGKIYDSTSFPNSRIKLPSAPQNAPPQSRATPHPEYLDILELGTAPLDFMPEYHPHEFSTANVFIDLYHPSPQSAWELGLAWSSIKGIFAGADMQSAFSDGEWATLCQQQDEYQDWYNIFFNRHIPLDITAIGLKDKLSAEVTWLGCVGGYIGGDFNNMLLAWHDSLTDQPEVKTAAPDGTVAASNDNKPWQAIKRYLDYLWEQTNPAPGSSGKLLSDRVQKAARTSVMGPKTTGQKLKWSDFPYGVGRSLTVEQLLDTDQLMPEQLPILEVGGGYGRDAFFIFSYLKTRYNKPSDGNVWIYLLEEEPAYRDIFQSLRREYNCNQEVSFVEGNALKDLGEWPQELQKQKEAFGVVCSYQVLHQFSNAGSNPDSGTSELNLFFKNCYAMLKPGGYMVHHFLSDWCPLMKPDMDRAKNIFGRPVPRYAHTKEAITKAVSNAGFDAEEPEYRYVLEEHCTWDESISRRGSSPAVHRHYMWYLKARKRTL
jgi:SAM-dependent methyltransferase